MAGKKNNMTPIYYSQEITSIVKTVFDYTPNGAQNEYCYSVIHAPIIVVLIWTFAFSVIFDRLYLELMQRINK